MKPDKNDGDPFGEYAPEGQTAADAPLCETQVPDEIETAKYGSGKPRRIIVRGNVAEDKSPDSKGK